MDFRSYFLRILFVLIFFAASVVYGSSYSSYSVSELKKMEASTKKNLETYQKKADKELARVKKYKNKKKLSAAEQGTLRSAQNIYRTYSNLVLKCYDKLKKIRAAIDNKQIKSLTISGSSSVNSGSKITFTCKAKNAKGKTSTVTPKWSVSNTKYASFSGNTLTAKSAGAGKTVTITATYSGKKVTKKITIKALKISSISISGAASLESGRKAAYTCKVKYSNGKTSTVTPKWSVSNTKYASFSGNTLTAKSAGAGKTVTITATYSGKKVTKKITIKALTISSVSISGASLIVAGKSAVYKCTIKYSNGQTATVTPQWKVSNSSVAKFSGNTLITNILKGGSRVTITASYQGKQGTASVRVVDSGCVVKKKI